MRTGLDPRRGGGPDAAELGAGPWCRGGWTRSGSPGCGASGSTSVDEFSYRKRHHYLLVVVDHDKRRVVWAGKGRSAETLKAFFDLLGPSGCEQYCVG